MTPPVAAPAVPNEIIVLATLMPGPDLLAQAPAAMRMLEGACGRQDSFSAGYRGASNAVGGPGALCWPPRNIMGAEPIALASLEALFRSRQFLVSQEATHDRGVAFAEAITSCAYHHEPDEIGI